MPGLKLAFCIYPMFFELSLSIQPHAAMDVNTWQWTIVSGFQGFDI